MKKGKLYIFILLLLIIISGKYSIAQSYANEWINYNQQYFKIHISEDGVYRIPYATLLSSGIPVGSLDPRNIQIFHNGEEQYIYIHGENSSGIWDPGSYIEFYGKRNRGDLDLDFYDNPANQVNPDYSFYNDTSVYFLTWNFSTSNRRMTNHNNTEYSQYIPYAQGYCYKNIRVNYTGAYYEGSIRSLFTEGEGWFDAQVIVVDAPCSKTINVPNYFSGTANTYFEITVAGVPANQVMSSVPHHLKVEFLGQVRIDRTYSGYQFVKENITLPSSSLTNPVQFTFTANDAIQPEVPDRNAVSYINIKYPHTWDFENLNYFDFYLPINYSSEKDYIEITNFNISTPAIIYDLTNNERISVENSGGVLKALVNNTGTERFLAIANQAGLKSVDRITKVSSNNKFTDYIGLYPSADFIIITHKNLWTGAQQYASYRSTTGLNVALLDVDQLYDQFAWGVRKHPSAIRRYNDKIYELSNKQKIMFLIGKSIHYIDVRNSPTIMAECLVPSAGYPSSDNLLTAGLADTRFEPLVGTGRLSVSTNQGILNYLDKVIEYESNPPEEWMKSVIHFGGGISASEQTTFASYLNSYKLIIEDTLFGGRVSTFLKTSSEPIQITQSDSIQYLINNGVSLMTFFGHGSSSGFDQNIDYPENYYNTGKYPFILANSCYSGDIHLRGHSSISESWVNSVNKGSIGFLASVGDGLATYLNIYAGELYKNIAYKAYGMPISLQMINSIEYIGNQYPSNPRIEITCHEFTLHGDPSIRINYFEKPDLTVTPALLTFIPGEITTVADSFDLRIVVKNIGRATNETFFVSISRSLPDGTQYEYNVPVYGCNYFDTIYVKMPVDRLNGPGLNTLTVFVDAGAQVDESNENNNQVTIAFLIKSGDLFPVYPYKYSIYPSKNVNLIASTGDPFSAMAAYKFQIDTTDQYNSPLLNQTTIYSEGGIVSWGLPFEMTDNRVYYWRIARDHSNPDSLAWKESTFIYMEGEEGWSQAHFYQFKEDDYNFIIYDRPAYKFTFVDYPRQLVCQNTSQYWLENYNINSYRIDGSIANGLGDWGNCGTTPAMLIAVIDPETILAWSSDIADFGHRNYPQCWSSNRPQFYFTFTTGWGTTVYYDGLNAMKAMIESVPDGHYILAYSWSNGYFENWPDSVKQTFEDMGAVYINSVLNGNPYIFFTKKGTPSSTQERFGNSSSELITLSVNLSTDFDRGKIKSVTVGPSNTWKSLNWEHEALESPSDDSVVLKVYGINNLGQEIQVMEDIVPDTYEIFGLEDSIDYTIYPNLKLEFFTKDATDKTPAQLINWQLRYLGVPETAIDPKSGYYFCCDSLEEGDEIKFAVATKNISTMDMDSLVVKYWIQNSQNEIIDIDIRKLRNHPSGDVIIDTIVYSSIGLSGINSIWIEYNPINESTGTYYQPEQHHFNNIAVKYFHVQGDITNPLLDVSFDGRYIMNGEIISAKPEILIKLKDENQYLALNDTSLFRIYLTDLQTGTEKRVYFGLQDNPEETMEWIPADLPENSAKIIYNPIFTTDGLYRLRVQAKDVSENESGENDYVVDFEVITQSTITHLLNYPNPFSTRTRFVFELTGSEVPDELQIQIFTVTGKLVKVIFLDEIGPVYIGKNITEYAWDGKDMYGDQLANGVYFYQVKAKINGEDIDHRSNESDKYFKKEIGKMYLIR
ncbi:MAG TPA: C25 family cysteine peptidase [Bacteroidales bacterium]|nr:C25 family cysteine peptidase [Bacteroidales bacterium]